MKAGPDATELTERGADLLEEDEDCMHIGR